MVGYKIVIHLSVTAHMLILYGLLLATLSQAEDGVINGSLISTHSSKVGHSTLSPMLDWVLAQRYRRRSAAHFLLLG